MEKNSLLNKISLTKALKKQLFFKTANLCLTAIHRFYFR